MRCPLLTAGPSRARRSPAFPPWPRHSRCRAALRNGSPEQKEPGKSSRVTFFPHKAHDYLCTAEVNIQCQTWQWPSDRTSGADGHTAGSKVAVTCENNAESRAPRARASTRCGHGRLRNSRLRSALDRTVRLLARRNWSYTRQELPEVVAGLRRLLDAIARGEVSAEPGKVNRSEGAVAALQTLARATYPPPPRLPLLLPEIAPASHPVTHSLRVVPFGVACTILPHTHCAVLFNVDVMDVSVSPRIPRVPSE